MHFPEPLSQTHCRRTFLSSSAGLLGGAALSSLLSADRSFSDDAETQPPWQGVVNPLLERLIFKIGGTRIPELFDLKTLIKDRWRVAQKRHSAQSDRRL